MRKQYQKPQCEVLLIQDGQDIVTASSPGEVGVDFEDIWGITGNTKIENGGF